MQIDVSAELGLEPLTLKFGPTDQQMKEVDIYKFSDELADAYKKMVDDKAMAKDADKYLRPVFKAYGYEVPVTFAGCDVTAQAIRAAVIERKKKFETGLWGTGADSPGWLATIPDSQSTQNGHQDTEPSPSSMT